VGNVVLLDVKRLHLPDTVFKKSFTHYIITLD
jgi:hypothetical protein